MSGKVIEFPERASRARIEVKLGEAGDDFGIALLQEIKKAIEAMGATRVRLTVSVERIEDE